MSKIKKILGLDLGVASLGWAINAYDDKNKRWYIEDFGVRLWDSPEDSKTLASSAEKRREKRSIRRSIRRKSLRKEELTNIFVNNNLLSRKEIDDHYEKLVKKDNGYDSENEDLNPLLLRNKGLTEKLTLLQLHIITVNISKARGYENKFSIEIEERLDESKELIEKYGFPIKVIMNFDKFNSGSLKFAYKNKNKAKKDSAGKEIPRNRENYLFLRSDIKNEYDSILKTQIKNNVITNEIAELLSERLFRQRYFEDGPTPNNVDSTNLNEIKEWKAKLKENRQNFYGTFHSAVGNCTYYPKEKRISKSSIFNDLFVIANEISKITDDGAFSNLKNGTKEEILTKRQNIFNDVITNYLKTFKFSKTEVQKVFDKYGEIIKEKSGVDFKSNNFFLVKLNKIFPELVKNELKLINYDLTKINDSKLEKIGAIVSNFMTPERIVSEFRKILDIRISDEELISFIRKASFSSGRLNVSKKFIVDYLNEVLNNGIKLQDFSYNILDVQEKSDISERIEKINKNDLTINEALRFVFKPNINNDKDMMTNGVVFRSINQTRLIIRALLKTYGWFNTINLEVARDLYAGSKERKSIRANQDQFSKTNEEIKIQLEKIGIPINGVNIRKYKLWEQQKMKSSDPFAIDLYDINLKEKINLKDVYSIGKFEEDHIIPYSVMNDNTIWNRVITKRTYNQEKGKRTPIEYFKSKGYNDKQINVWLKNVKKFNLFLGKNINKESVSRKYSNLGQVSSARDAIQGFETKDLNDTRYISKYLLSYFKSEFKILSTLVNKDKVNINAIVGRVTSNFRREWLKNSPWGLDKKVREITPYHHSIDAIIVSQFKNYSDIQFSTFFQSQYSYFRFLNNKIFDNEMNIVDVSKELLEQCEIFLNYTNNEKVYVSDFLKSNLKEYTNELISMFGRKKVQINTYLKPLNINLKNDIENLVPIKLSIETIEEEFKIKDLETKEDKIIKKEIDIPKFESEVSPQEWSKINNRDIKLFPYPSYKIEKKIKGTFAKENPAKKSQFEDKVDGFYEDSGGNIWKTEKYFGINLDPNEKNRVSVYEALNDYKISGKRYKNVISRNEVFELEGNLYIYKGSNEKVMSAPSLLRNYAGEKNYKKIFESWPHINISKNIHNLKKININKLGKINL